MFYKNFFTSRLLLLTLILSGIIIPQFSVLPRETSANFTSSIYDVKRIRDSNRFPDLEPEAVIGEAILFLLGLVAVLGLLAIVIGGILYILSIGDEQKATRAKNTILYAIIGTILASAAWIIMKTIYGIFFS